MKIESGIAMPKREPSGRWVDLYRRMKIGDSVLVEKPGVMGLTMAATRNGGKARTKKISENLFRIWRLK